MLERKRLISELGAYFGVLDYVVAKSGKRRCEGQFDKVTCNHLNQRSNLSDDAVCLAGQALYLCG